MFAILSLYRTALLGPDLAPFEPLMLVSAVCWTIAALVLGTRSFVRHEEDLARYL